jgi:hypothetical protein
VKFDTKVSARNFYVRKLLLLNCKAMVTCYREITFVNEKLTTQITVGVSNCEIVIYV